MRNTKKLGVKSLKVGNIGWKKQAFHILTQKSVNFVNFVNKCAVCLFFQESVYFFRKSCSEAAKQRKRNTSGHCCSLLPIRSASSGVLFVGCWYYLQKSERFTSPTAHQMAPSRFARVWAFGRRAQAIHLALCNPHCALPLEKSRQNRTRQGLAKFRQLKKS